MWLEGRERERMRRRNSKNWGQRYNQGAITCIMDYYKDFSFYSERHRKPLEGYRGVSNMI